MDSLSPTQKTFRWEDQDSFAALSGDYNPMHMDPIFARRTQAGRPVVHGVHNLMWAIDSFFHTYTGNKSIARIQCKFSNLVHVGERADLCVVSQDDTGCMLKVRVGEAVVTMVALTFGGTQSALDTASEDGNSIQETGPIPRVFQDAIKVSGWFEVTASPLFESSFPWACKAMGQIRMAGLAALSRWVGMVNPGLHSIFTGLDVRCVEDMRPSLRFRVAKADERYRHLRQELHGCGLSGTVDSLVRQPPIRQASMERVKKVVAAGEFSSVVALVIGMSRGLGEVTAKLIAAGGGKVVGTYAVGQAEAEDVAEEIRAAEGSCDIFQLLLPPSTDVGFPAVPKGINCLFYFATPPVVARSSSGFDRPLFDSYIDIYATGFARVCTAIASGTGPAVCAFYPSTVYVEDGRPADLIEYAMAKAAGEVLCSEMPRKLPKLTTIVRRIPRVLTDLSASAFTSDYGDPLQVMLPIVRDVTAAISKL